MGGAGGHMFHPFDCPDVNSGQDLIEFFQKCINSIRDNPPALKIDGVNLSFRLRENPALSPGFEFVVDRGSMKNLDVQGVTADNADERFVSKDPSKPHGMVEATKILLGIFNSSLPEILPELERLKMTDEPGHFGLYFNTEFVLKKINVKEYPFNFIAIHGVSRFVPKGPKSRKGINVNVEQKLLDQIRDKVQTFANQQDFKVFTRIPASVKTNPNLQNALNEEFSIVYSRQMRDPEEPGEMGIGEGSTKPLKAWLAGVDENPIKKIVNISEEMREKYPQMGKKQSPYAKNIYLEVLRGTPINKIAATDDDIEPLVDGVVIMHATRILGNAVLDALESDDFGPAREQEGVVINDNTICAGTPFKLTGDFIVGGLETSFREQRMRPGRLIEGIINEQVEGKYVILIPGGFKPPTGGHYSLIKQYERRPDVEKIIVVTGPKPRDGVTLQQSQAIFDIYGGFDDKVEFFTTDQATPLSACYELMKDEEFAAKYPNMIFALGAGNKGGDPQRIQQFKQYFDKRPDLSNATIGTYEPAKALEVAGKPASASRMRGAMASGDWETFKSLLPDDNFYDDVVQVLMGQTTDIALEEGKKDFLSMTSLYSLVDEVLLEKKKRKKLTKKQKFRRQVSKKISKLRDEGYPQGQAVAIALNMMSKKANKKKRNLSEVEDDVLVSAIKGLVGKLDIFDDIRNIPNFEQVVQRLSDKIFGDLKPIADQAKIEKDEKAQEKLASSQKQPKTEESIEEISSAGSVSGGAGGFGPPNKYNPFKRGEE
tara:strand:+ start:3380 stop:5689 length:2310 start_codon:yes stop_codon:yes gene_type:complete